MSITSKLQRILRTRTSLWAIKRDFQLSTSQFSEDLLLSRLLHPNGTGTYLDVGCNHPIRGSNTYRLYAKGWSGLAIDPNPQFSEAFRRYRPLDTHLAEGVALSPGELTYYRFEQTEFNTFSPEVREKLIAERRRELPSLTIRCRPLSEIVDEHLKGRFIDVLNVDCEGLDVEVLQSLDLQARRPSVVIVEDYDKYIAFRDGTGRGGFENFLRDHEFSPIAQCAWSSLFVANDWREMFARTKAFDASSLDGGYLPGQAKADC